MLHLWVQHVLMIALLGLLDFAIDFLIFVMCPWPGKLIFHERLLEIRRVVSSKVYG